MKKNKIDATKQERSHIQAKIAEWLLRLAENEVAVNDRFFAAMEWCCGDLCRLLETVTLEAKKLPDTAAARAARKALRKASSRDAFRLDDEFEDIAAKHPCLRAGIMKALAGECAALRTAGAEGRRVYRKASRRLQRYFGLNGEALRLCEYVAILQYRTAEEYFEDELHLERYGHHRYLAHMLGMPLDRLRACIRELRSMGLLLNEQYFRLWSGLHGFWENPDSFDAQNLFCRALTGETLPLEEFSIAQEEAAHAAALLQNKDDAPVHILLYGPAGTGKTTFARSLAKSCGVKAWSVLSRKGDEDSDRRASLASCLHIASRHKGAFVLVDEAERLLDTDMHFGRQTKDKAWLNDFLEQPGRRVIWITNQVGHIDDAVRRRFSYSIFFDDLGQRDRTRIWQQALRKRRASGLLGEERIEALVRDYDVPAAVIDGAISQAKRIQSGKAEFTAAVERILRAYTSLRRNGGKARVKPRAVPDFSLEGVCLEGSVSELLEQCRRVDAAMRDGASLRPGLGAMLFYGPPGTGKTALARYIARELDRECLVRRASDIFGSFVGETEQNIERAFSQAEKEGAVLVIDEADTFLYSRDIAQRSWETSFVNEFLTALEECRSFCICTTNRRESLDAAAMRRFSHKVAFAYARAEQVRALYAKLLAPLCVDALPPDLEKSLLSLSRLTPGDFHAVRSQYDPLLADAPAVRHERLVAALRQEEELKTEQRGRRIGF